MTVPGTVAVVVGASGGGGGGGSSVFAQMSLSADQTLSNSADDKIDFDLEDADTDGNLVNLVSSRFDIQEAGHYAVKAFWPWGTTAPDSDGYLACYVNGTYAAPISRGNGSVHTQFQGIDAVWLLSLSASDTVEIYANTGGTSNVVARGNNVPTIHTRATVTIAKLA